MIFIVYIQGLTTIDPVVSEFLTKIGTDGGQIDRLTEGNRGPIFCTLEVMTHRENLKAASRL